MTPSGTSEDADLVQASLAGNREAFGEIVGRYQSLVCSLAYSATGSLAQSEDLAQETFLTAWKQLAGLREPAKLRAWLCGIARNLIYSFLRAQGREPSHHAEPLEEVAESRSAEPLPVERVISREEAEILWRSLERIPETYREPLVLYYREHQSIEAVAQQLDLTEEAARQRLSRGRKLLQEEVQAFVEVALAKTSPGRTFTVAVVAALPIVATTAKAASVGAVAAKAGTGAKGLFSLAAGAGLLSMVGAILFSWKTAVDDSKSRRERRFMTRMAWYQVGFFILSIGASLLWLPTASHRPWVFAIAFMVLILANVINGAIFMPWVVRRRMEIAMEEGTMTEMVAEAMGKQANLAFRQPGDPAEEASELKARKAAAMRRTIKLTIPFLLMFAGGAIALPWKQHAARCAVVVAAEMLVIVWYMRKTYRQLSFQAKPWAANRSAPRRNPFIMVPVILFGAMLLGGALGYLLPFFLNPGTAKLGVPSPVWLRPLGLCLLCAVAVYAVLAVLCSKTARRWKWLGNLLELPLLRPLQAMTRGPDAVLEATYRPIYEQLNLNADQRAQLKDLVLKRTMVGVRAGMSLMNWKLEAAKRAELTRQIKSETEGFNAKIKEFLGPENCAAFEQFEKTIPDRTMLGQFERRLARTPAALSAETQARLLETLTQARREFLWTTGLSMRNQTAADFSAAFGEGMFEVYAREEREFARQFVERARQFLDAEQLAAFEKVQASYQRSQEAQYKMAAKLFRGSTRTPVPAGKGG